MPITILDQRWILETDQSAYVLGLNTAGKLAHIWWGARLPRAVDYPRPVDPGEWSSFDTAAHRTPLEYPGWGGTDYTEPCLKVTFADGVRDTVLDYAGSQLVNGELPELILTLRDRDYPLRVDLHYRLHETTNLIERWVVVTHEGSQPVTLERVFSAQWHLPADGTYTLRHTVGRWNDEMRLVREPLMPGCKVLESRRLTSSHHANPWFSVDRGSTDENQGEVWFGALVWSGNWKLAAEVTEFGATRLSMGVNDWDFAWTLHAGETFTTPACLAGYTHYGYGAASRLCHDYIRSEVLPHGKTLHPVLYNAWEAVQFAVDEPSQMRLADLAAEMGVELFVVDDGWFKGRENDRAGLGDWTPDLRKFPRGLGPLIQKVHDCGMRFGLWVEPEMVNANSDLFRAHPDWVIQFPTRARTEARNQMILNLARTDVQNHLIDTLDRLLSENAIDFIKWDMNRNVSEPGWQTVDGDPREFWVRYVQGLYRVWGTLRNRHAQIFWQGCSGGGGRADLGILHLADQLWTSDNTDAKARLRIQEGFSQLFPANVMEAWVTDAGAGNTSLSFRFHVSMCGSLGVGGALDCWSAAEREEARSWIELYKSIRPVVQQGYQYRLLSLQQGPFAALNYVSKDGSQGVLFAFHLDEPGPAVFPRLRLRGLDPQAVYRVEGVEDTRSGAAWMEDGLDLGLGCLESTVRRIERVD